MFSHTTLTAPNRINRNKPRTGISIANKDYCSLQETELTYNVDIVATSKRLCVSSLQWKLLSGSSDTSAWRHLADRRLKTASQMFPPSALVEPDSPDAPGVSTVSPTASGTSGSPEKWQKLVETGRPTLWVFTFVGRHLITAASFTSLLCSLRLVSVLVYKHGSYTEY